MPQPDYWRSDPSFKDRWRSNMDDHAVSAVYADWACRQVDETLLRDVQLQSLRNLTETTHSLVESRDRLRASRMDFARLLRKEYSPRLHKAVFDRSVDFVSTWYLAMERLIGFTAQFRWLFPSDPPSARSVDKYVSWLRRLTFGPDLGTCDLLQSARAARTLITHSADAPSVTWMTHVTSETEPMRVRLYGFGKAPAVANTYAKEERTSEYPGDWWFDIPGDRELTNATVNVVHCVLAHISSALMDPRDISESTEDDGVWVEAGEVIGEISERPQMNRAQRRAIARDLQRRGRGSA